MGLNKIHVLKSNAANLEIKQLMTNTKMVNKIHCPQKEAFIYTISI